MAKLNLGWLADLVAQKLFKLGQSQPQRRAWNVDGFTINDDPDNQWLDIEPDIEWIAGETTTSPVALRDTTSDLGNAANGLARADHDHAFGADPTDTDSDAVDLRYDASTATVDTTGLRVAITALGAAIDYAIAVEDENSIDVFQIASDGHLSGPNGVAIGAQPSSWQSANGALFLANGTAPTAPTGVSGAFLFAVGGYLRAASGEGGANLVLSDVSVRNDEPADIRRFVSADMVSGGFTGSGNPINEPVPAGKAIEIHYRVVVKDSTGNDAGLIVGNIIAHENAGGTTLDAESVEHTLLPAGSDIASDSVSVALVSSNVQANLVNNGVNEHTAIFYHEVKEYNFS